MASTLFTRLPFAVSLPNAPVINAADVSRLVPLPPLPVDGYWLFGNDNAGLVDQIYGHALAQNLSITITNQGAGYTVRPSVSLVGGGGTGWVLEAIRTEDKITGITVVTPGTPFTSAPTVVLTGGNYTTIAQATASISSAPTINPTSLTIPSSSGVRNGLLTPFDDSRDQTEYSVIRAFAPNATENSVIMGSIGASSEGGDGIFYQTSNYRVTTRPNAAAVLSPTGIVSGQPLFIAKRHRSADNHRSITFGINGALVSIDATVTKTLASPMRKLALGNAHLVGTNFYGALEAFAYAAAAGYQSDDQVALAYQRFAFDLGERGERLQ